MPIYEYYCEKCNYLFEQLLNSSEKEEYKDGYPCPQCGKIATKLISKSNFVFKSDTPGNSGVHDLDYPSVDKAVGRSANRKWKEIHKQQEARDKVRKETGKQALSTVSIAENKYKPASKDILEDRKKLNKKLSNIPESNFIKYEPSVKK